MTLYPSHQSQFLGLVKFKSLKLVNRLLVNRTHTSPAVINMLKNLSLASVSQKNKQIDAKNDARALKALEHEQDPEAHPDPGSETA
jgi:hypothetical protein